MYVHRWKAGVGSSLNYLYVNDPNKSPLLIPYPNWEANTLPVNRTKARDDQIISTFRIRADECNRLWVMDTGVDDIVGDYKQYYKPAIVIFDLTTDRVIKRYELQETDSKESSFFANIVSLILYVQ